MSVDNSVTIGTLPTLANVTTVGTVSTITGGTITNQQQIGGIAANTQVLDAMYMNYAIGVRGRIS